MRREHRKRWSFFSCPNFAIPFFSIMLEENFLIDIWTIGPEVGNDSQR